MTTPTPVNKVTLSMPLARYTKELIHLYLFGGQAAGPANRRVLARLGAAVQRPLDLEADL
jgi:hypothetical protein